jgi:hypothetical protein
MAVSLDKVSSRFDEMAPQLYPFEIQNFKDFARSFTISSDNSSPQASWTPSQKLRLIMAVSLDKLSSRLDGKRKSAIRTIRNYPERKHSPKKRSGPIWI